MSRFFVGIAAAGAMIGLLLNSGPGGSSPAEPSVAPAGTSAGTTSVSGPANSIIGRVAAAPVR